MLFAVATFVDHKYMSFYRKPYKIFYIEDFIIQTIEIQHLNTLSMLQ